MPLSAESLASWNIEAPATGVLAHAAGELRAHLERLDPTGEAAGRIRLTAGNAAADGFEVSAAPGEIVLHGESERGTLNAVYWLLEQAGFLWPEPGEAGVCYLPGKAVAEGIVTSRPSFARRTLILGQDALHQRWPEWLEWASRNRLNDIFFHDTPPTGLYRGEAQPEPGQAYRRDGGGWMFELWDAEGAVIRAEAAKRGLALQFGGHHLPTLLPRAHFEEHPEWFPLRDGLRKPRYNLCPTSQGAIETLRANARDFFERFGGADVYHLWADDIPGGGWCGCDGCAGLSASDQALLATNAVAGVLAEVAPGAKLAHLVYHDTLAPPRLEPAPNVTLLYAPRERCYAHAIDDERCPKNRGEYWPQFEALGKLAGGEPGRVQVFEYYSDAILFKGMAPPHLHTLPADARAYREAGVENLQNLMVGTRPWVGNVWHAWWHARCSWDVNVKAKDELGRFCAATYPENTAAMQRIFGEQERAYRLFLNLHDLEPLRHYDVLDFSDKPRRTLNAKAPEALEGALILAKCERELSALSAQSPAEADRLARECIQAAAVSAMSAHLGNRVAAWDAALDGLPKLALQYLAKAEAALERYEAWDARHGGGSYEMIARRVLAQAHWHTENVRRLIEG